MTRIDEDIVAKAAFYAGLAQTLRPEELPSDIRDNGNSLLRDVVDSVCNNNEVDRGSLVVTTEVGGSVYFSDISKLVPTNVICNGRELTLVGLADFLTVYRNNPNVCCIHHSVVDAVEEIGTGNYIVDHFGKFLTDENGMFLTDDSFDRSAYNDVIAVETWCDKPLEIICNKSIAVDESKKYLRVDCRNAVRSYIIDFLAFRLASMYQMASKDDCATNMGISLNQCKKVEVPHISIADPVLGMQRMRSAMNSPLMASSQNDPMRGY